MPSEPSSGSSRPSKKKFATLGDLSGGAASSHAGHGHDSDDDDDDHENQDLFAGGEKSGLAVQNPDDLKRKILERAKKCVVGVGKDLSVIWVFRADIRVETFLDQVVMKPRPHLQISLALLALLEAMTPRVKSLKIQPQLHRSDQRL